MTGLPKPTKHSTEDCVEWLESKSIQEPGRQADQEMRRKLYSLEILHRDVCGLVDPTSMRGERYFVTLYDDTSAVSAVCL